MTISTTAYDPVAQSKWIDILSSSKHTSVGDYCIYTYYIICELCNSNCVYNMLRVI